MANKNKKYKRSIEDAGRISDEEYYNNKITYNTTSGGGYMMLLLILAVIIGICFVNKKLDINKEENKYFENIPLMVSVFCVTLLDSLMLGYINEKLFPYDQIL